MTVLTGFHCNDFLPRFRDVLERFRSRQSWLGVCGSLPKTLALFITKICNFPYPICDLTKNLIPYLWPDPLFNTLFQAYLKISYLVQNIVKGIVKDFCWWSYQQLNDEKVASLKNIPNSRLSAKAIVWRGPLQEEIIRTELKLSFLLVFSVPFWLKHQWYYNALWKRA